MNKILSLSILIIKPEFLISLNVIKICDKSDATSGIEKATCTITTGAQTDIIISSNEFYKFKTEIQQGIGKLGK